jgi:hypothetical protein
MLSWCGFDERPFDVRKANIKRPFIKSTPAQHSGVSFSTNTTIPTKA